MMRLFSVSAALAAFGARWPMPSISSMNSTHGASSRALRNRRRTRDTPTPRNLSEKSLPDSAMKFAPHSPASARASSVLPVPGGPSSRTPRGGFAPSAVNAFGDFR